MTQKKIREGAVPAHPPDDGHLWPLGAIASLVDTARAEADSFVRIDVAKTLDQEPVLCIRTDGGGLSAVDLKDRIGFEVEATREVNGGLVAATAWLSACFRLGRDICVLSKCRGKKLGALVSRTGVADCALPASGLVVSDWSNESECSEALPNFISYSPWTTSEGFDLAFESLGESGTIVALFNLKRQVEDATLELNLESDSGDILLDLPEDDVAPVSVFSSLRAYLQVLYLAYQKFARKQPRLYLRGQIVREIPVAQTLICPRDYVYSPRGEPQAATFYRIGIHSAFTGMRPGSYKLTTGASSAARAPPRTDYREVMAVSTQLGLVTSEMRRALNGVMSTSNIVASNGGHGLGGLGGSGIGANARLVLPSIPGMSTAGSGAPCDVGMLVYSQGRLVYPYFRPPGLQVFEYEGEDLRPREFLKPIVIIVQADSWRATRNMQMFCSTDLEKRARSAIDRNLMKYVETFWSPRTKPDLARGELQTVPFLWVRCDDCGAWRIVKDSNSRHPRATRPHILQDRYCNVQWLPRWVCAMNTNGTATCHGSNDVARPVPKHRKKGYHTPSVFDGFILALESAPARTKEPAIVKQAGRRPLQSPEGTGGNVQAAKRLRASPGGGGDGGNVRPDVGVRNPDQTRKDTPCHGLDILPVSRRRETDSARYGEIEKSTSNALAVGTATGTVTKGRFEGENNPVSLVDRPSCDAEHPNETQRNAEVEAPGNCHSDIADQERDEQSSGCLVGRSGVSAERAPSNDGGLHSSPSGVNPAALWEQSLAARLPSGTGHADSRVTHGMMTPNHGQSSGLVNALNNSVACEEGITHSSNGTQSCFADQTPGVLAPRGSELGSDRDVEHLVERSGGVAQKEAAAALVTLNLAEESAPSLNGKNEVGATETDGANGANFAAHAGDGGHAVHPSGGKTTVGHHVEPNTPLNPTECVSRLEQCTGPVRAVEEVHAVEVSKHVSVVKLHDRGDALLSHVGKKAVIPGGAHKQLDSGDEPGESLVDGHFVCPVAERDGALPLHSEGQHHSEGSKGPMKFRKPSVLDDNSPTGRSTAHPSTNGRHEVASGVDRSVGGSQVAETASDGGDGDTWRAKFLKLARALKPEGVSTPADLQAVALDGADQVVEDITRNFENVSNEASVVRAEQQLACENLDNVRRLIRIFLERGVGIIPPDDDEDQPIESHFCEYLEMIDVMQGEEDDGSG